MTCKNHYKQPLGSIGKCDCDCPKRPRPDKRVLMLFENCSPIAGNKYTSNNVIFDVDPDSLPVTMAATIENFGPDAIFVSVHHGKKCSEQIPVQPGSSLTFVHDKVVRITVNSLGEYTGSFKYQITYEVEKN